MESSKPLVSIVIGSMSDWDVMKNCASTLEKFGVPYERNVASAHRTPEKACQISSTAQSRGIKVMIAAAGGAAHLAGVIAAHTQLPVLGVPMVGWATDGMDSLLSTVQMPTGIPVATVAVGGGDNAAYLAAQILSIKYPILTEKLLAHREKMAHAIEEDDRQIAKECAD